MDDFQGVDMQLLSALSCVSAGLSAVSDVSRSRKSDFKRFGPSKWFKQKILYLKDAGVIIHLIVM